MALVVQSYFKCIDSKCSWVVEIRITLEAVFKPLCMHMPS